MRVFYIVGIVLALWSASAVPARGQMSQEQFKQKESEFTLMALALEVDKKCALLNSVSRSAAKAMNVQNSSIFAKMGIGDQVKTLTTNIEKFVKPKSCAQLAAQPNVKQASQSARLWAGVYLMGWDQLYKRKGDAPNGEKTCGGGSSHTMIRDAVKANAHFIENLKNHPQAKPLKKASLDLSLYLEQVCRAESGMFDLKYGNYPLGTVIYAAIDASLYLQEGPGNSLLKVSPNSDTINAYRGATPPRQQAAQIPWAVLREAREHVKEVEGQMFAYFNAHSSVHVGFLRDKRFAVSAHPPSMAKFSSDIYKEIIVKAVKPNKEWRLKTRTSEFDISYNPAKYDKAQFVMSQAHSSEVLAAVNAGSDLQITMVRNEKGRTRAIEVETINGAHLKRAIAYAYAPKITF